jgi:hypothetical protein
MRFEQSEKKFYSLRSIERSRESENFNLTHAWLTWNVILTSVVWLNIMVPTGNKIKIMQTKNEKMG